MKNCKIKDKKNIALRLYELFEGLNKPKDDIAIDLEVDVRTIYHWIDGTRIPTIDKLIVLSDYLGVQIDDLLL